VKRVIEAQLEVTPPEIELEAFGVSAAMDGARPVMLFREKGGESVLPVWLSPLDAGIAITQHQPQVFMTSPHEVSLSILKTLGVRVKSVHFREVRGHQQYVELLLTGSRKIKSLTVRADHAMSFCLQAVAKFYCTKDYLEQCRQLDAEMGRMPPGSRLDDLERGRPHFMN